MAFAFAFVIFSDLLLFWDDIFNLRNFA